MAHAVVRTDKLFGTDVRTGMVSVLIEEDNGIDNGCVAILGDLAERDTDLKFREVYEISEPEADSDFGSVVLIASPEVNANPLEYALDAFTNKKDSIARGYRLHHGDIFSVTGEALAGVSDSTAAGDIVELKADYKLNVVASATEDSTVIGKIIDIETVGSYKFFVIEVTA